MSGKGAPELSVRNCGDLRVAVIAAQWHEKVMDGLVNGALRALHELGIDEPTLLRVPRGRGWGGGAPGARARGRQTGRARGRGGR
ncbi:6,7-dimethyl-8-ribityllumazine synthase, partial [Streptomyces mirabilis]|uniref:6,7-dimethyl-8-ribityllumazine synthase n=1 Tax=Streptomyces mirabilis TaxID=68239 RepID=UPI0036ABC81B